MNGDPEERISTVLEKALRISASRETGPNSGLT
jgi:hypothetical protein